MYILTAMLLALIATNLAGYPGFLVIAIITPITGVVWFVPRDKWPLLTTGWSAYTLALCIGSLFHFAFAFQVANYQLPWLTQLFIGEAGPRILISALLGVGFGFSIVALPVFVQATTSALFVMGINRIYDITRWQAVWLMVGLILRFNPAILIIEEGRVKETTPKGWPDRIGGPALVVIRPYHAVVLEQAGRVSRIEGPGEVTMAFEERIKEIVDLRRQAMPIDAQQVLTRDRVPLRILGGVGFRIQRVDERAAVNRDFRRELQNPDQISFLAAGSDSTSDAGRDVSRVPWQAVYDVVYHPRLGQKWTERVQGDAELAIRRTFRGYDFSEIYQLALPTTSEGASTVPASLSSLEPTIDLNRPRRTILDTITDQIIANARESAQAYGVQVFGVAIRTIQLDQAETVRNAYFDALIAEWSRRAALTKAEADQQVLVNRATFQSSLVERQINNAMQQVQGIFQGMDTKLSGEVTERLLAVLSRLLENAITDHATARRYLDTMETLARVNPNTIIAAGMDISQMNELLMAGVKPVNSALPTEK